MGGRPMKKSQLVKKSLNNHLDSVLESPFCEKKGLLEFKEDCTKPEFFANWSFITTLYGERVQVDHCVLTFPDLPTLKNYIEALRPYSVEVVEGLGLFPMEFCPSTYTITNDLWFYLLTILIPSGGLVVLVAPHIAGDQLDRFLQARGKRGIHHVAIRVDDIYEAALHWHKKGFQPLSDKPLDSELLCQWFVRNSAGQIIELIHRLPKNNATFYCQNIGGLRRSEIPR